MTLVNAVVLPLPWDYWILSIFSWVFLFVVFSEAAWALWLAFRKTCSVSEGICKSCPTLTPWVGIEASTLFPSLNIVIPAQIPVAQNILRAWMASKCANSASELWSSQQLLLSILPLKLLFILIFVKKLQIEISSLQILAWSEDVCEGRLHSSFSGGL